MTDESQKRCADLQAQSPPNPLLDKAIFLGGSDKNPTLMDYLTKHFFVLSSAATCFAFIVGIAFIYSYLAVFDRSLIILIEGVDIVKIVLMSAAILSTLLLCVNYGLSLFVDSQKDEHALLRQTRLMFGMTLLATVAAVAFEYYSPSPHFILVFYFALMFLLIYTLVYNIIRILRAGTGINKVFVAFQVVNVVFLAGILGAYQGYTVKYNIQNLYDVVIRKQNNDTEQLRRLSIVIMLSRYAVFYSKDAVYVYPVVDVLTLTTSRERGVP